MAGGQVACRRRRQVTGLGEILGGKVQYLGEITPLVVVLALILLIIIVFLVARLLSSTAVSASVYQAPFGMGAMGPPADPQQMTASHGIYDITEQLWGVFNVVAHPAELEAAPGFRDGVDLLSKPDTTLEMVVRFANGDNMLVSCMALEAMRVREDTADARRDILYGIGTFAPYAQFFALRYLTEKTPANERLIGRVLATTTMYQADRLSRAALEDLVRRRHELGEPLECDPDDTWFLDPDDLVMLRKFLGEIDPKLGKPLLESLGETHAETGWPGWPPTQTSGDGVLKSAGRIWSERDAGQAKDLIVHAGLEKTVDELKALITAEHPQSVLLTGESGAGKKTLKSVLANRMLEDKWTVFIAGHNDLMAGQMYIGQLEQRLKRIVEKLQGDRKTVWFIPDIDRLAFTGTHSHSNFSVLDAILPHIADGTLRVVADAHPSTLDRLLQKQPRISSTMVAMEVKPASAEATLDIASRWLDQNNLKADDGFLRDVWDLAQQYLGDRAAPGNVMDLLKSTYLRLAVSAGEQQPELTADDVIVTLAQQTGLPLELLDAERDLDLDHLEAALSERVIGQEEAVGCLVDRVAMMKAGLADPTRPYGVFLFAGPTGTGKTEIAKSLATWLFGSVNRLIRIDMSELQTPESLDRLLGSTSGTGTESLANQVHKQPFSVILLDEFEKAHPKVWDLFLQIFDDARATERSGRTVSFRHTIIILTANLGATIPTGLSIGFSSSAKGFDVDEVRTAVGNAFRREFINRLDRVIVFHPLDRELMRKILHRELREAFDRRGLKGRPWAVEWDESAMAFLLEKGFTPDLGARPLKRAVERYLLSPLAAAIIRHQFPEGDQFLFISCSGDGLRVEFVDPDLDDEDQEEAKPSAPSPEETAAGGSDLAKSILLQPGGSLHELAALRGLLDGIEAQINSEEWQHRKHTLFTRIEQSEFWSSPERYSVLGLLETTDRIEKGKERASGLLARLDRQAVKDSLPRRLLALLAQNIYLLTTACDDVTQDRPRDAFLMVEAHGEGQSDAAGAVSFARQVADMYESWAKKRNMRLTRMYRSNPRSDFEMRALYSVSGYGAYSILEQEYGLHVRERPGGARQAQQRDTIHVSVIPQPDEPLPSPASRAIAVAERAFENSRHRTPEVVRRYREAPSPLVRDTARGWRTGRIDLVLGGDFDLL